MKRMVITIDKIPNLPNEEWRPIEGYDGKYLISNCGRVKSLKHYDARLLKAFANNNGFLDAPYSSFTYSIRSAG